MNYFGLRPKAPPGSLLKQAKPAREKPKKLGRSPRDRDEEHLEAIRQCPCILCGKDPAGEAAHIRFAAAGKPNTGMGARPDDRYSLPLCHNDHMRQHTMGEREFWQEVGIDPLRIAEALWNVSPNVEGMRAVCFVRHAVG